MTLIWVVDAEPHLYSDNVSVEPCVAGPSRWGLEEYWGACEGTGCEFKVMSVSGKYHIIDLRLLGSRHYLKSGYLDIMPLKTDLFHFCYMK